MLNSLRSNGGGGGDYKEGREDKDDEDVEEFHGNNHFRDTIFLSQMQKSSILAFQRVRVSGL